MQSLTVSRVRLVLSDMDGTLLPSGTHEVSEVVRRSIIDVENQGVPVVAVTARPYSFAKNALTLLGADGLCVVEGGATIRDLKTDEIVWRQWLDPATLKNVSETLLPLAYEIDYFPDDKQIFVAEADTSLIDWEAPYVYVKLPTERLGEAVDLISRVSQVVAHAINLYDPIYSGLQVTHELADKSHGVAAVCNILQVPKEQTLAIGDGDNDIPLFENAGLRIAMGNASDKLISLADHVVGSVDGDGFADAMSRFVLK